MALAVCNVIQAPQLSYVTAQLQCHTGATQMSHNCPMWPMSHSCNAMPCWCHTCSPTMSARAPSRNRSSHRLGGGSLMLPHFALQNGGSLCATNQGMYCHSPPHKDSDPFVGGGLQVLQLELDCHRSSSRRRSSSSFSSSSIVRMI